MKKMLRVLTMTGCIWGAVSASVAQENPENPNEVSSASVELFVAPAGNDANSGTKSEPFATLERARYAIRERKKQPGGLPAGGVTVYLRGGIHRRTATFTLNVADSGIPGAPVVYQAFPGEKVVLVGGVVIPFEALKPISDPERQARIVDPEAAKKILEVDLRALGVTDVGQLSRRGFHRAQELSKRPPAELFVDGVPQTLARWPNAGETVRMGEILDPGPLSLDPKLLTRFNYRIKGNEVLAARMEKELGRDVMDELLREIPGSKRHDLAELMPFSSGLGVRSPDLHKRGGTFRFDYDRPLKWLDSQDIWVSGVFGFSWEYSHNQVALIDREDRTITLRYGEMSGIVKNWFADFHYFENVFEEIDLPGEYYIDRETMKLYFYPPGTMAEGGKKSELMLSILDRPVVEFAGASNIVFRGLNIAGGRSDGVVISESRGVLLADLMVHSVAGGGVVIHDSFDSGLEHCEISHVGGRGVLLGGGDWPTLTPGGNFVDRCVIHDFAYRDKAYHPGVEFGARSVGNRATGNQIYNGPHGGIDFRGNDHLIQGNQLHSLCREFLDFGAIYANAGGNPMDRGTKIIGNYIHDIRPDARYGIIGIYLDVAVWSTEVRNNIISNVGGYGIYLKGHYLVAENNFIHNVPTACRGSLLDILSPERLNQTFTKYPPGEVPHYEKYPELLHFWEDIEKYGRSSGFLNLFANNVIFDPGGILTTPNGVDGGVTDYATGTDESLTVIPRADNNLVLKEDPGFTDWKAGDFRYIGNDHELKKRLAFVNELFDAKGRFVPAAEAGLRR